MKKKVDISVIIVNYNVKEYVASLLLSVNKASHNLNLEVIVVDNHSADGSSEYLPARFPDVTYIFNDDNIGFGKANNIGISRARGEYILLINPDTLIREDTLITLKGHMDSHPNTGAAGCKLLNPDGTFAPESRRSVPTPASALWKILGLAGLFPNNRFFSSYYLSWIPEDEAGPVPVLSGAFMFFRADILKKLNGFDERFFMYGEDIDLCFRLTQEGFQIDYVPHTSIIHYKGESTKKENLDYVILFNKAMYQFFEKHYSYGYTFWFSLLIKAGILLRAVSSYAQTMLKKSIGPALDLTVLNVLIFIFFLARYKIHVLDLVERYQPQFLVLNLLLSVFFVAFSKYYDLYGVNRYALSSVLKSVFFAFTGVVVITFFLRDYAFSRWILLSGAINTTLILFLIRLLRKQRRGKASGVNNFDRTRILLVGVSAVTAELIRKIRSKVDWNADISGIIVQDGETWIDEIDGVAVIGRTTHIPDLVRLHKIDQIMFSTNVVSNDEILSIMTQIHDRRVLYKIVPDTMEFMIGKANVEYFDDIPVMDVQLAYTSSWNQFLKRSLDLFVSLGMLVVLAVPAFLVRLFSPGIARNLKRVDCPTDDHHDASIWLYFPYNAHLLLNRFLLFWNIFKGTISLVGAPIIHKRENMPVYYKPGLTGLLQLNASRLKHDEEKEKFELYYVRNYSIWLDIDILFSSMFQSVSTLVHPPHTE